MEQIKSFNCCFTGHRSTLLPSQGLENAAGMRALKARLEKAVDDAVSLGAGCFYAGGAEGFDTLAAETVLKKKSTYPFLRLCLALPEETPPAYWSTAQKRRYERILALADEIYVSPAGNPFPNARYHHRNRYMVDHADLVIAYLVSHSGGTYATVTYALERGRAVWNLAADTAISPI